MCWSINQSVLLYIDMKKYSRIIVEMLANPLFIIVGYTIMHIASMVRLFLTFSSVLVL